MDYTGVRRILASEPAGGKAHHASVQLTGKRGGGPKKGVFPYLFRIVFLKSADPGV
jgi:hypothetical protein